MLLDQCLYINISIVMLWTPYQGPTNLPEIDLLLKCMEKSQRKKFYLPECNPYS